MTAVNVLQHPCHGRRKVVPLDWPPCSRVTVNPSTRVREPAPAMATTSTAKAIAAMARWTRRTRPRMLNRTGTMRAYKWKRRRRTPAVRLEGNGELSSPYSTDTRHTAVIMLRSVYPYDTWQTLLATFVRDFVFSFLCFRG